MCYLIECIIYSIIVVIYKQLNNPKRIHSTKTLLMIRLVFILFFCANTIQNYAQQFIVDVPKQKKNEFARSFVKLLNDAPNHFKDIVDKPIKGIDSAYPNLSVYNNKIKLKGAPIAGKIVLDSIPFAEYFYGKFDNLENAEATYVNLSNNIAEALDRKVLFKNEDGDNTTPFLKQTKIAFTQNSGFFLYNIFVQLYKNDIDSSFTVLLKIKSGTPPYFYKIMQNEPINSFMFVGLLKTQLPAFQKQSWQGCLGNLQPFICKGTKKTKDTLMVIYVKSGFEELVDAKKEFEAALTNMRVCMSNEYVYFLPTPQGKILREVAFLKFDDIEKKKPKILKLALVEEAKRNYFLELGFIYK